MGISNIIFLAIFAVAVFIFSRNVKKIIRNVNLGKDLDRTDNKAERLKTMLRVAFGQSKMVSRPIAGILHLIVYVGFIIINIEVIEILIDGIFGTHRVLAGSGAFYDFLIGSFEILAFLVLVAVIVFLIRRNVLNIARFRMREMGSWPKTDANIILVVEILLMGAFLTMNASDQLLQQRGVEKYIEAGAFPISQFIAPLLAGLSTESLIFLERFTWWFHIIGILAFLNYLPISKHLHIILAFPNTYYSNLNPIGKFKNNATVTKEVQMMLDPNADPFATPAEGEAPPEEITFGAKDIKDLSWKNLLDAYSCTECGRCTSVCPANQTGKLLSPRKIMMDTRDRMEEIGKNLDLNGGVFKDDGKALLGDYITEEEIWACTSCNACVQECPVNIDPLGIIMDLRNNLVMEQSKAPGSITSMFNNVENNGAPWAYAQADRLKWAEEA
ncbi:MAG: 4Fe-4S dicluster domain-containing protein [Luteibaculaceae bacterium]